MPMTDAQRLEIMRQGQAGRQKAQSIMGGLPTYQASPEMQMYYMKLTELLNDPQMLGFTPAEEQQYMTGVRRMGEDVMQEQGKAYDVWAARRGIRGGPEGIARIKLAQELMRNMTNAKMNMNDLGFRARTQARLAALGGLGGATRQFEDVNAQNYQAQLMDQLAKEELYGSLIGKGVDWLGQKYLPMPGV